MQSHMQKYVTMIADMMKSEGLYASQGGPIILSQVTPFLYKIANKFASIAHRLA